MLCFTKLFTEIDGVVNIKSILIGILPSPYVEPNPLPFFKKESSK
jgi:hypothetical protein